MLFSVAGWSGPSRFLESVSVSFMSSTARSSWPESRYAIARLAMLLDRVSA